MLGATGFFNFTYTVARDGGTGRRFAFAYKPPGQFRPGVLHDILLGASRGPIVPDAVVMLCISEDAKGSLENTLDTASGISALERLQGKVPVLLAELSLRTGKVSVRVVDKSLPTARSRELRNEVIEFVNEWMTAGLRIAFPENLVILQAPPGYAYQKPSGATYNLFLKPDLALTTSAAVSFVSLALFRRTFCGNPRRLAELQTIFVDTMAISNVAYGLRDLIECTGLQSSFSIESFHSYGGFDAVTRPLKGTSLCIISASSSMSLHKQWIAEKRVGHSDVVTLLTFEDSGSDMKDGVLLAVAKPNDAPSEGPPQLVVRIQGETFLPSQEPDKKVLLRELVHGCFADISRFREFSGLEIFDVYRRPASSNSKVRSLFVDGERLLAQEPFKKWLREQLLRRAKACVKWIVHQPDDASLQLAIEVKKFCEQQLGLVDLNIVTSTNLRRVSMQQANGVIVCSMVVGKGSNLLEISRTLRDLHDGPRLYLIGFQVAEARAELDTLMANLRHDKLVSHDIARFGQAAIGTQLLASFALEKKMIYPPGTDFDQLPADMSKRAKLLGEPRRIGALALLPHGRKMTERARLREGWAFWTNGYSSSALHPEVLASVGVILQRARENKSVPVDERLTSPMFRHVVLDPENFTRFNDGILQAALLRNAFPSELDYRADYSASDFMKAVILRSLRRVSEEAGESALEFLLALETRRLQLFDTHLREVVAEVSNTAGRPLKVQQAITHICGRLTGANSAHNASPI